MPNRPRKASDPRPVAVGANTFGRGDSESAARVGTVTRFAEPDADRGGDPGAGDGGPSDAGAVADRIRARAERVRRRELETALGRLASTGEVTPAERRAVASLSATITDALVDRWASNLDEVDADAALVLLAERG